MKTSPTTIKSVWITGDFMWLVQKVMELEMNEIQAALVHAQNNKTKAASYLGIERTTLIQKMKKYGFPVNPPNRKNKCQDSPVIP